MATLHDTAYNYAAGDSTTLATADSLAVTAGDLIVVLFKHEGSALSGGDVPDGSDCSDGQSNEYALANAYVSSTQTASIGDLHAVTFYATAGSTGTITPTVTTAVGKVYRNIKAYSFTPAGGKTLELGNVAAAQGTGTSMSAGSASATAAGAAVCGFAYYDAIALTPGDGWSEASEFDSEGDTGMVSQYLLQSGSGSLTGDGVASKTNDWIAQIAIFNEAGGGGPTAPSLFQVRSNIRFN